MVDCVLVGLGRVRRRRDYRDAIERAVRYGRDTDTTAAIAGGLAGIRFGRSGIPAHWLAKMRGRGDRRSTGRAPHGSNGAPDRGSARPVADPARARSTRHTHVRGLADSCRLGGPGQGPGRRRLDRAPGHDVPARQARVRAGGPPLARPRRRRAAPRHRTRRPDLRAPRRGSRARSDGHHAKSRTSWPPTGSSCSATRSSTSTCPPIRQRSRCSWHRSRRGSAPAVASPSPARAAWADWHDGGLPAPRGRARCRCGGRAHEGLAQGDDREPDPGGLRQGVGPERGLTRTATSRRAGSTSGPR